MKISLPEKPRYGDAAPIVVRVTPPWSEGTILSASSPLRSSHDFTAFGFAELTFAYPGTGVEPDKSGGTFDAGGEASVRALRDVLRFATGLAGDSSGRTIGNLPTDFPLLATDVGVVGVGEAGNTIYAALGQHGNAFPGLKWMVAFETPVGSDLINLDLGAAELDPDPSRDADGDGITWNDGRNIAYAPGTGMDWRRLRFNPLFPTPLLPGSKVTAPKGVAFLDNNGNGAFDARPGGSLDSDRDGKLGIEDDFAFRPSALPPPPGQFGAKVYYSIPLLQELESRGTITTARPPEMASLAEAEEYWRQRDGSFHFDAIGKALPDLMVGIVAALRDHTQVQPDHPHVRRQYEGLRTAGVKFVRLNPDFS